MDANLFDEPEGGVKDESLSTAVSQPVPEDALHALEKEIEAAGGPFEVPEAYKGAVGRTMFDTPGSKDGSVTVLMPSESLNEVPRQSLVRIRSIADDRVYLGAVIEGPF